jgi:hypothetical protein
VTRPLLSAVFVVISRSPFVSRICGIVGNAHYTTIGGGERLR